MTDLLRRLWPHILPRRRRQFGILFLLMIFTSFAEVLSIGAVLPFLGMLTAPERVFEHELMQPFVQALSITNPKQLLLPITITFGLAALFSGAMRLVSLWAQTRLSHAIGGDFSISTYRRTLYQPYAVHLSRNSSDVIAGAAKAYGVVGSTIMPIIAIASSAMMLFSILFALLAIDSLTALGAFSGFGAIYVLVIILTKKILARDGLRASRGATVVVKALQEGLGGIRDVLIDGTQATYCKIYGQAYQSQLRAVGNISIISNSPRLVIEALGMVLISMLAYSMAARSEGITSAIPVLGALALGAQRLLPVMQQAFASITSLRGSQAALSDALDLLDQQMPAHADEPFPTPIPFQHNITLKKLDFSYAPQAPQILQGLDLTIPKGSRIGIIGPTGSGKSTLIDIIMGLLFADKASLEIDGIAITAQNHRAWQVHIAHVPQAIFLADTTLAENIAFGVPFDEIDFDRMRQAAEKAQIAQAIETLDQKYDTLVGERGVRLSGGQRQRIGIARALYKQANVIVFDEATSALDNDTESAVMEAIENLGDDLTILIVAHRLTTLKNCTQIVELANGKIKRSGTYEEIVSGEKQRHEIKP